MSPVVCHLHGAWFALPPSSEGKWRVWHRCRDVAHAREVVEQWAWLRTLWELESL